MDSTVPSEEEKPEGLQTIYRLLLVLVSILFGSWCFVFFCFGIIERGICVVGFGGLYRPIKEC